MNKYYNGGFLRIISGLLRVFSYQFALIVFVGLLPAYVGAQTLVMIPGFQSQGMDWRLSQVAPALQERGWVDGGNFTLTRKGIVNSVKLEQRPKKVFYTVDLVTEATIAEQARTLQAYLAEIHQRRNEPLTLAGHSAGGVVARHWLVTANKVPVETLITIASPHLGTPLASLSSALTESEDIVSLAEAFGLGSLTQARGLYRDLREEQPGTYLFWLNRQVHPAIRYVSVVRSSQQVDTSDVVVPVPSQDMNNVYTLRNRVERWDTEQGHFLSADDGYLLDWVMSQMKL